MVKDYKLDHEEFPELQQIIAKNTSSYYIGRAFRGPSHMDHMPLHKIEDLFQGNNRMLTELALSLVRRDLCHQAAGVCIRSQLDKYVNSDQLSQLKQAIEGYDPT